MAATYCAPSGFDVYRFSSYQLREQIFFVRLPSRMKKAKRIALYNASNRPLQPLPTLGRSSSMFFRMELYFISYLSSSGHRNAPAELDNRQSPRKHTEKIQIVWETIKRMKSEYARNAENFPSKNFPSVCWTFFSASVHCRRIHNNAKCTYICLNKWNLRVEKDWNARRTTEVNHSGWRA